jgi:GTP-binding protein EngB required for normal cell division
MSALRSLAKLDLLPVDQRRLAEEAADKLADSVVYVAVVGEFKRGKSSLINALLGDEVLPTGVTPVTAAPTLVRFGEVPRATVRLSDDTEIPIGVAELPDYITEAGNPRNGRGVREVVVEYPSSWLGPGIVLADTPGTGSVHAHNTQSTVAFLPRVDVALMVLSVSAPLSEAEGRLLTAVGETAARAAICLSKVDLLSPDELAESLDFVAAQIEALTGGISMPIFPVSARAAARSDDGGLAAVRRFLSDVIVDERDQVVRARARKVAGGLVSLADGAIQLERAAASRPEEEARTARAAFATAQAALETDAGEAVTLLLAACRRTETDIIEPRAEELRGTLPQVLLAGSDPDWEATLGRATPRWAGNVEVELSGALADPLTRHADRLQERLGRFVQSAGAAFGVDLPPPPDVRQDLNIPPIRIETVDEPGAVAMGVRQLRQHVPGPLGHRWRQRDRQRRAEEDADRLAGRLRYAAVQAVDTAARAWARDIENGWRSLSESLGGAVTRAEQAVGSTAESARLIEMSTRIAAIREAMREVPHPSEMGAADADVTPGSRVRIHR